jgi:tetratricopeptide (TPR) repeat protein
MLGNSIQAIDHFQQAFELCQRAGDISYQALARNHIANAHFYMGQWREAERHYRQARQIFDQIGDVYNRAFADNNLGGIACNQGRLDEALAFYQEGLRSVEQIGGSLWVLGGFHNNLGMTFIRRGEVDAAYEHLRTSQDYFEQAQARDWLPELYYHFAEAGLLAGDLAKAQAQGEQALSLARELSMRREEGCALRVLGEIATARGQFDKAEGYLDESLSILKSVGDEYEWARSQLCLARLYTCLEREEESQSALERCSEVFQRLGADLDLETACSLRDEIRGVDTAGSERE